MVKPFKNHLKPFKNHLKIEFGPFKNGFFKWSEPFQTIFKW